MIDKLKLESAQSLTPKITNFNLTPILQETIGELVLRYKNRQIFIPNNDLFIKADDVLIKQVLINLIENALKYSQDDIYVTYENGCILLKDSGVGIEDDELKLITKKFF